ncbi:ubiquitin-conjugating enzyme E2 J1 [Fistulifera solaris]|uniref:Ubiquitin-conjugating enzyme E2 J1 n=1 Tax=Fistulifera solaris TaxID=1519565 RepID=A0A1Z5J931_FISSO|nr:ubiquitin-conjugating enzyme E2 J1 [Fistulifera solaris]|eukprot:GAX10513.1 ubiquitin-conjugating enzyme E2 J1 [Fistulifera solaris]
MSKSPSLRRIQADIRELAFDPSDRYHAAPMENDMFEWHFTIRGADGTDFEGGIYHGRILLPPEYPMRPPNIIFLTPSGRFETNTKICLSFSAFHPELWQPAWGIRLILEALISFLPTPADGAIGALDWSSAERKKLAAQSVHHECPICGKIARLLPEVKKDTDEGSCQKPSRFQKEIEELQKAQQMQHALSVDGSLTKLDVCREIFHDDAVSEEQQPKSVNSVGNNSKKDDDILKSNNEKDSKDDMKEEKEDEVEIIVSQHSGAGGSDTHEQTTEVNSTNTKVDEEQATERYETDVSAVDPPIIVPDQQQQQNWQSDISSSWFLSDPVLNAIIMVLSMTCYLLLKKIDAVMEEIYALESE